MSYLNDDLLEKVNGGTTDWEGYAEEIVEALKTFDGQFNDEHKKLFDAIKRKDWIEVGIIAIPLISANDPLAFEAMKRYMIKKKTAE